MVTLHLTDTQLELHLRAFLHDLRSTRSATATVNQVALFSDFERRVPSIAELASSLLDVAAEGAVERNCRLDLAVGTLRSCTLITLRQLICASSSGTDQLLGTAIYSPGQGHQRELVDAVIRYITLYEVTLRTSAVGLAVTAVSMRALSRIGSRTPVELQGGPGFCGIEGGPSPFPEGCVICGARGEQACLSWPGVHVCSICAKAAANNASVETVPIGGPMCVICALDVQTAAGVCRDCLRTAATVWDEYNRPHLDLEFRLLQFVAHRASPSRPTSR